MRAFLTKTVLSMMLASGTAGIALAQAQQDQMKMVYQAARNQLGVLGYCQTKGFGDADAVATQQKMLAMIPVADKTVGDEAEATGKKGVVSALGTTLAVEDGAKSQGMTVAKYCETVSAAVKQAGASLPK